MGNLFHSPTHLLILIVVLLLLFGAPKLPGMARSLGQSMRIFKSEVSEMRGDTKSPSGQSTTVVNGEVVKDGSASSGEGSTAAEQTRPGSDSETTRD